MRESNFYVITDENQIYKCISNSGGQPSTIKPTGTTTTVFRTSDGYKWKFMYKIPQTLMDRFASTSYIPVTNPTTRISLSSGGIDRVIVSALGSGYVSATITVEGDGTDADLVPVIENGQIVRVIINDAGVGYTYAKLVVSGIGVDGNPITIENQAKLNAVLAVEAIDTKQESVELNSVPGSIENIKIISGGENYNEGTTTFTVDGDGTGLVFTPVFTNGVITELKIENAGRNYSYLTITAQDLINNEFGAVFRPIISPPGGHGSNAIDELFASVVAVSTKIRSELNNGVSVSNNYIQNGIIRSIRGYRTGRLIDKDYASACFVVYGVIRAIDFPVDSKLISPEAGNTFTVIDSKDGQLLLSSDSTRGIKVDEILYSVSNNVSFSVTDLIEPDFDVFTGTVCSINNQSPFTHAENQTLELVTYLVFEDIASLSRTKMP